MADPTVNDLYAALLNALENAALLAHEIDAQSGTTLAASIPSLPTTAPTVQGASPAPAGPTFLGNGATAPDADQFVMLKAAEDIRSQYSSSSNDRVRAYATTLPHRWYVQDTLDSAVANGMLANPGVFQLQSNLNRARTLLGMIGAAKTAFFNNVVEATPTPTGLYKQGATIPDAGVFAGDLMIGGKTLWAGVRIADAEKILQSGLQQAINGP